MNNTKNIATGLIVIIFIVFLLLLSMARNGYGYMGYRGYNSGPSFWYWGGTRSYYDSSIRSNRTNGGSIRGGGPGSGK